MTEQNPALQLTPWISFHTTNSSSQPLKCFFNTVLTKSKEVILISVISIKPQTLSLIGKFTLNHDQIEEKTLVFLSPVVSHQDHSYQIAYVPHRQGKAEADCLQSISDILRSLSEIVITDVCCNGPHKYKDRREGIEGKQYVIVSNKDIYQIQTKQAKIELTKKVGFVIDNQQFNIPEVTSSPKSARLDTVNTILDSCIQQFSWFLNSDKSWKTLSQLVLTRISSERHLEDCFALEDEKGERKFLTKDQLETVKEEVLNQFGQQRSELTLWAASIIMREISTQNSDIAKLLLQLIAQFSKKQAESEEDIGRLREQAQQTLSQFQLPLSLSTVLTHCQQKNLLQRQNQRLKQNQGILKELLTQRNNQLILKNHKIDQLKQIICEFTERAEEMKRNTQQLIELTHLYDQEKQRNWKLQLEVDSHVFMANKNAENKVVLENEILALNQDKADLLIGLQEMTSENLTLMSERQRFQQEIKELKERIEDSSQVQARALKSIQNQAEVKVRLGRYEHYVQELKQVFSSFKRMEIEKFNYILQRNYREYEELQEKYKYAQFQLRRGQSKLKEMAESLHCQRVKLAYFEKMYAGSYSNEPIPEVSEENSATDREPSSPPPA